MRSGERRIIAVALVWASAGAALSIFTFGDLLEVRATVGSENPITFARAIGIGAVVAALLVLDRDLPRLDWRRLGSLMLLPLLVAAMAVTGSRGPLLAGAVAVALSASIWAFRTRRPFAFVASLVLLVVLAISLPMVFEGTRVVGPERLSVYLQDTGANSSDSIRLSDWSMAWDGTKESGGLGLGTGDFASLIGRTGRVYPHNVVLEVGLELGIIGLLLLLTLLVSTVLRLSRLAGGFGFESAFVMPFAGILFFAVGNALVSGDLSANYQLWVSTALVWTFAMPEAQARTASVPAGLSEIARQ
jgi:O-antigen ligase